MIRAIRLRYVTADVDRYGTVRYYFRRRGVRQKIRLHGLPGSAEFMDAYQALLDGRPLPPTAGKPSLLTRAESGSFRWLCQQYFAVQTFKALDVKTRRRRESILMMICDQPTSEADPRPIGNAPFAEMPTKAVRRIRDRKGAESVAAANDWLKALKALFKWAVDAEYCDHNPAKDVPKFKVSTDGFHTWTIEEVEQFEAAHAVGTIPRLAMALLLYTGCRRSDVVLLGPQHIKDGWLTYTQQKNKNRSPVTLSLPILATLADIVAATPSGHLTFLATQYGKPFSVNGFGNRFRDWCDKAGLPHCSAHGLRKAGASRAAENGATTTQLMAIYGWRDINQAETYTRKASQKRLAGDSMHLIGGMDKAGTNVSHSDVGLRGSGTISPKRARKSAS
jgi:integrase